jgi:hypothetical protein
MTAILTQRCDPFGMETERYGEKIAGGLYGPESAGKYKWHCEEAVTGRYRMVCTGGDYGFRRANDSELVPAYHCDGGHRGQVMNLCAIHVRQFSVGPRAPGWNKDKTVPHGIVGGTVANELCPPCAAPPEAREHMARADFLQAQLSAMVIHGIMSRVVAIESELNQVRCRLDELHERGIIHKCPLKLVEVS